MRADDLRALIEAASTEGAKPIEIRGMTIEGSFRVRHATVTVEVSLIDCHFTGAVDLSFTAFKQSVNLEGSQFPQGLTMRGARIEYDFVLTGTHFETLGSFEDVQVGAILDARGANFDWVRFDRASVKREARFESLSEERRTEFNGTANFDGIRIEGSVTFAGAIFRRHLVFEDAHVGGTAHFTQNGWGHSTTFLDLTLFTGAQFGRVADFDLAEFGRRSDPDSEPRASAIFRRTFFADDARFTGVWFSKDVSFARARINGQVSFDTSFKQNNEGGWDRTPTYFGDEAIFEDIQVKGQALFSWATFVGQANFDRASFQGAVRFSGADFRHRATFEDVRIDGPATFSSDGDVVTRFRDSVLFRRTRFSGLAAFDRTEFGPPESEPIDVEEKVKADDMTGGAIFHGASFGGDASFQGVRFSIGVGFDSARIDGRAFFRPITIDTPAKPRGLVHTIFGGPASFIGVDIKGGAFFEGAEFVGPAYFGRAHFGSAAGFQGAQFHSEVEFEAVKIEGPAIFGQHDQLGPVRFEGQAQFRRAEFGAAVSFFRAVFAQPSTQREGETSDQRIVPVRTNDTLTAKRGGAGAVFHGAVFKGDVDFQGAQFKQGLELDGARIDGRAFFRPGEDPVRFGGRTGFIGVQFKGQAFFNSAIFEDRAAFMYASFSSSADFSGVSFKSDVSFAGVDVRGDARFGGAVFTKRVYFREGNFRAVFFRDHLVRHIPRGSERQFRGPIDLRGFTYTRVYAAWDELLRGVACWERDERQQVKQKGPRDVHERQPYTQLENSLRAMGRDTDADDVYYALRSREWWRFWRSWNPWHWVRGMGDTLFWALATYGVQPWRLLLFAAVVLLVGMEVFASPGAVTNRQASARKNDPPKLTRWEALGVSISQFLPVEVSWGGEWKPKDTRGTPVLVSRDIPMLARAELSIDPAFYGTLHRLAGWVLVPLGVAAVVGILHRRPRR